jgi:hypothetical protein
MNMLNEQKKTPRQVAAVKLLALFASLSDHDRHYFQEMLFKHAFLDVGNSFYRDWAAYNELDRWSSYSELFAHVSEEAAEAWRRWAFEIAQENLVAKNAHKNIVDFLRTLVIQHYLKGPHKGGDLKKSVIKNRGRIGM